MHRYGDWRVYIGEKHGAGSLGNLVVLSEDEAGITHYETVMHMEVDSYIVGDNATLVFNRWGTL